MLRDPMGDGLRDPMSVFSYVVPEGTRYKRHRRALLSSVHEVSAAA